MEPCAAKLTIRDRFRPIGVTHACYVAVASKAKRWEGASIVAASRRIYISWIRTSTMAPMQDAVILKRYLQPTYIYAGAAATTGAPSHCVALLAKATK